MPKLQVLHEGKHHLVVYKPENTVVVDGRGVPKPTILDMAQAQFGKGIRPVHRLDRVTAGCLILAKDLFGQQALSNAFRKHLVDKRYLAIVEGEPAFTSLNIDARLERIDNPNAKKGPLASQTISQNDQNSQRALTRVKVWAKGNGIALIEARPETGRMHQIRAHLSHVGYPIVGDKHYGAQTKIGEHVIALFAFAVSFPAPKEGRVFAIAPNLPEHFQKLLKEHMLDYKTKFESELRSFKK